MKNDDAGKEATTRKVVISIAAQDHACAKAVPTCRYLHPGRLGDLGASYNCRLFWVELEYDHFVVYRCQKCLETESEKP